MTPAEVWNSFASDDQFKAVLVIIALDIILGVAAAIYTKHFKFERLVEFAHDDLLAKVFPWLIVYSASKYAPDTKIIGLSLGDVAKAVFATVCVALLASLYTSLQDLKLPLPTVGGGLLGREEKA